ncbi:MAG: M24 family metallopeptidase [bacterium]
MSASTISAGGRANDLSDAVRERGMDALLVGSPVNVQYLSGFAGSSGLCLVGPDHRSFLTDFRYVERADEEVGEGWSRPEPSYLLWRDALGLMPDGAKVGFEDASVTVRELEGLRAAVGDRLELFPAGDLVEGLREIKDAEEVERIRAAAAMADGVFQWLVEFGFAGRSELEVLRACEIRITELGAATSFPPIIAAGPNGAIPHAEPGDYTIAEGDLLTIDMGVQLDYYCSDCTRTYAVGEPSDRAREVYETVLAAQTASLAAVKAGAACSAVDSAGRELITEAGYGPNFGHGTGHGVGMEIHEAPRVSQAATGDLRSGQVITVEPGIYLPGELGVRIEDLVVVTEDGFENLSSLPKELKSVG